MQKEIIRRDYCDAKAASLKAMPALLQRIYAARHIESQHELEKELTHLLPYESLLGINDAVLLLAEALANNQKIVVIGDFDADGATSTTVAVRALKSFGAKNVDFLVPNRFAYGYGLTPELVEAAKDMKPDLIVTVDNGIANHAGVSAAKAAGIRVVITDHHLPAETLPDADAIVNPNQHNDPFPSKNLAGVGVIFYVMLALRRYLVNIDWFKSRAIPEPNMSTLLDIVALGTVADVVPLDQNNRILVHQGLRRIRAGQCIPAIVALLELSNRDFTHATASDLGFAVGARLNAAGRIDDMSLGINCLLLDDSNAAREAARLLDTLNNERKGIEQEMQAQALQVLTKLIAKLEGDLPKGLCLFDETWHQGVIGILAARIKDKYHRPVIIFACGNDGEIKGSARSIAGLHVRDAMALVDAKYPNLIKKFGGHAMAAGLTIARENFSAFAKAFDEVVSAKLTDAQLRHSLFSDGDLLATEYSIDTALLLRDAGPWGQAFPEPVFDDVFKIIEQRIVGDKHLKLRLAKDDKIIDAVAFFIDTTIWPNHRCQTCRAAFRLDINEYKGRRTIQLVVDYIEALE